jgi:hypothetical protein
MGKADREDGETTMRDEYDFDQGVRGKYADRVAEGTNVVVLDPDVAAAFKDEKAVNRVLRAYLQERQAKASSE